jgi:hypothetical protein
MANWISAVFTVVIAVATIVYVWFTKKLWLETKRSADAAMKAAEAAGEAARAAKVSADESAALNRPFIGLISVEYPLTGTNNPRYPHWIFPTELRNHGTLPATRVNALFEFFLGDSSLTIIQGPRSAEIFPSSAYQSNLRLDFGEKLALFAAGKAELFLEVRATYNAPDGRAFQYSARMEFDTASRRFLVVNSKTERSHLLGAHTLPQQLL